MKKDVLGKLVYKEDVIAVSEADNTDPKNKIRARQCHFMVVKNMTTKT